jgi:hypothetical protein
MDTPEAKNVDDIESCARQSYDLTNLDGIRQFQADHLDPIIRELDHMIRQKHEGVVPITEEDKHRFVSLNREKRQLNKIIDRVTDAYHQNHT